jgi:hypothetical protein
MVEYKCVVIFSKENSKELEDDINGWFCTYPKARLIDIKYSVTQNQNNGNCAHHALVVFTEHEE